MKSLVEFMLNEESSISDWDGYTVLENKAGVFIIESPKEIRLTFIKDSTGVTLGISDGNTINTFKVPLAVYKLIHKRIK